MATTRANISSLIQNDMAQRNLGENAGNTGAAFAEADSPVVKMPRKQKQAVKILLDDGDYARLQEIAETAEGCGKLQDTES